MRDLLDANVWLALSVPGHVHHARALQYWRHESHPAIAFCRITTLALVRLLTNPHAVGKPALDSAQAWSVYTRWRSLPGVGWVEESGGVDDLLGRWAEQLPLQSGGWTDAYLAALAMTSGSRLVSFDRDFARFDALEWLPLVAKI